MTHVWDATSQRPLWSGPPTMLSVSLAVSSDGKVVAEGADQGAVLLHEGRSGNLICTLNGHSQAVADIGFSPDLRRIVTCSPDGTARIWDARSGRQLTILPGDGSNLHFSRFLDDGRSVVTVNSEGVARLYSVH